MVLERLTDSMKMMEIYKYVCKPDASGTRMPPYTLLDVKIKQVGRKHVWEVWLSHTFSHGMREFSTPVLVIVLMLNANAEVRKSRVKRSHDRQARCLSGDILNYDDVTSNSTLR